MFSIYSWFLGVYFVAAAEGISSISIHFLGGERDTDIGFLMRDEVCDNTKLTKIWTKCCLVQRGALANPVFNKQAKQRSVLISCFLARNKEGVISHLILSLVKSLNTSISYLAAELKLSL